MTISVNNILENYLLHVFFFLMLHIVPDCCSCLVEIVMTIKEFYVIDLDNLWWDDLLVVRRFKIFRLEKIVSALNFPDYIRAKNTNIINCT